MTPPDPRVQQDAKLADIRELYEANKDGTGFVTAMWADGRTETSCPWCRRKEPPHHEGCEWLDHKARYDAIGYLLGLVGTLLDRAESAESRLVDHDACWQTTENELAMEQSLRQTAEVTLAALREQLKASERTVTSIATMLGWENVPPQRILEADISALKLRVATLRDQMATVKKERDHERDKRFENLKEAVEFKAELATLRDTQPPPLDDALIGKMHTMNREQLLDWIADRYRALRATQKESTK